MAYNPNFGAAPRGYAPPPATAGHGQPPGGYSQAYGPQSPPYQAPPPYSSAPSTTSGYVQRYPGGAGQYNAQGVPGGMYGGVPGGMGLPPPGISQDIWNWFQAVDADRNGKITSSELQRALMNGNWSPFNPETCRIMIGMFDVDRNGTIDINEFSALWKYIQDWKACFDRFDTDRSGNIDCNELQNAFRTFGYSLSMNFTQLCIRIFDRRQMRSINFDDFIQCCVMVKTLTDKFKEKDSKQAGSITIHYEEFLRMALDNTVV